MNSQWLSIQGIDPLLLRDGRAFSSEEGANTAHTLSLPMPSTIAGFVRTQEGNFRGVKWTKSDAEYAESIAVHGPLLCCDEKVLFSAPRDAMVYLDDNDAVRAERLAPFDENRNSSGGCDIPQGLRPLNITVSRKPTADYQYWTFDEMCQWLLGRGAIPSSKNVGLEKEVTYHNHSTNQNSEEGKLFSVEKLVFQSRHKDKLKNWSLLARTDEGLQVEQVGKLGGEGGLATVKVLSKNKLPTLEAPVALQQEIQKSKRLRMILATPGIFINGWCPGWIDPQTWEGEILGVRLKLVSAAVGRREAVSGWDFKTNRSKAIKVLSPAGSTYFFEILGGDTEQIIKEGWLMPVSDNSNDANNGYGMALWGVW